jgi:SAM-dependent methyltransferase
MEKHERFKWSVEILKVKPDDYILEIGCGVGLAAEEVAQHLISGQITAIDKSPAMVGRAIQRNQKYIKIGTARVVRTELLGFTEKHVRYNKVFCFNINLFWTAKSINREVLLLKSILSSEGTIYIFYGPIVGEGLKKFASPIEKNLEKENLKVVERIYERRMNCCCFVVAARSN